VSCDFNHQPPSCIIYCTQTRLLKRQVKVMAWYDNEWGFSNRLADLLCYWQTL
jgi:glyceraldehyde-3-phosphate dehydrogenase/erythrose-4-phosphate dehydrogenase